MDFLYAVPEIPEDLLHEIEEIVENEGYVDEENGGQYVPGEERRETFRGIIMPIGHKDLVRAEIGTFTQYSQKIYTNGYALKVGGKIYDPASGMHYTVKQELGYGSLHPMKRYLIEAKGE